MPKIITKRQPIKATPAMRRKFLATQNIEPLQPLTDEERKALHELIDQAQISNHQLVELGGDVTRLREHLAFAEGSLAKARCHNQELHAKLAPLFHRLPA
jgi:hypothetical protein